MGYCRRCDIDFSYSLFDMNTLPCPNSDSPRKSHKWNWKVSSGSSSKRYEGQKCVHCGKTHFLLQNEALALGLTDKLMQIKASGNEKEINDFEKVVIDFKSRHPEIRMKVVGQRITGHFFICYE